MLAYSRDMCRTHVHAELTRKSIQNTFNVVVRALKCLLQWPCREFRLVKTRNFNTPRLPTTIRWNFFEGVFLRLYFIMSFYFSRLSRLYSYNFHTEPLQSLTKAIIFELFYYINDYFRVWLTDIHEYSFKMPYLPNILINFSWAKSHNFFIMEKSKLTLLFNIC